MDPLDIGRWQFGITTVYHFFMVPLTLGLGMVVTFLYLRYIFTKKDEYKRMTKFWGKLYLINFAMGVATGLVQEFQFGMAWSEYSRFVGDVFGAPLAMEGLFAFFIESTFLGLWMGQTQAQSSRPMPLHGGSRFLGIRILYSGGKLLDAASGRR